MWAKYELADARQAQPRRLAPELPPVHADHRAAQDECDIAALHHTGAREPLMQQPEIALQRYACEPADQRIMEAIVGRGGAEDQVSIGFGPTLEIGVEQPILGRRPIVRVTALQHGNAPSFAHILPIDTRR